MQLRRCLPSEMELLKGVDIFFFYIINQKIQNSFFDILMPFVTNYNNWYFIVIAVIVTMIIRDWKRGIITVLLIIIAVSISDYLNSHIIKFIFGRLRPCNELPRETIHLLIGCPSNPSFPSSHASNIVALSVVLIYRYRVLLIYMLTIAILVCLSRVYLGVHYPSDVIAGGVCGVGYGALVIFLYNKVIYATENQKIV